MLQIPLRLHRNIYITSGVALFIVSFGVFALHHVPVQKQGIVANALMADMLLTFPFAYYLLVIKTLKVRKTSLLLVFTCCCALAYLILPAQQRGYIKEIRKVMILAEPAFLVYAFLKAKKIRKIYQEKQATFPDAAYHLRESMVVVLGDLRVVKLLAAELAVIMYALFLTRKERVFSQAHQQFTVHRQSGYLQLFSVMLLVGIIEIVGLHLLIAQYHPTVALVVTLLSIYGTFFIVADMSAVVKRLVVVTGDQLILRTGIRWRCMVAINNIKSVELIKGDYQADESCYNGAVTKSSANVLISFKDEVMVERLYKNTTSVKSILISIDDAANFKQSLNL